MIHRRFFPLFLLLLLPAAGLRAQDNDVLLNSEIYSYIDRLDVMGVFGKTVHTDIKPYGRKTLHRLFDSADVSALPARDQEWFKRMRLLADDEFASNNDTKGLLKYFYRNQRDLFSIHKEGFNLYVNPILYISAGWDQSRDSAGNTQGLLNYRNTRGAQLRGDVMGKLGFFTEVTENQVKYPQFVRNSFDKYDALFGEGFVKTFDDTTQTGGVGYDYFTSRGYLTYSPLKQLRLKLGKDRAFWGNGFQSLFLSDYATDHWMLDANLRIWQLEYTYHLAQMVHYIKNKPDGYGTFPRKYATFHQISWKPNNRMSFSIFESVVYSPTLPGDYRGFELEYLNPIIFFRSVEQFIGSPDNSMLGAQFKWNFLRRFQAYGQLLLDDFNWRNRSNGKGYWGNKYGYQVGLKWMNAFWIPRLDLQVETNRVRPFTYTHFNPVASFSHYGQFLGHSLGTNFWDFNVIVHYQPWPRWSGTMVITNSTRGENFNNVNWGGDVFTSYVTHVQDYNNVVGQGNQFRTTTLYGRISYQPFHADLYLDGELRVRKENDFTSASIMGSMRLTIPNKPIKF